MPVGLHNPASRALLPKAAMAIGWDDFENRYYAGGARWARYFNEWQPTTETVLFEGRCLQEMGETDRARSLYRLAHRFDPRSRPARLALIDLDLNMSEGKPPALQTVDALLALIPWDDVEAIDKIAARLAGMAESVSGSERLQLAARVLYMGPAHQHLRKAGLLLLQDASLAENARRIGAWVIAASLLEERGRLNEGDMLRLDQLLPDWADPKTKQALARGEFLKVSSAEMSRVLPGPAGPSQGNHEPFPICLEREWLMQLGSRLTELDVRR